MARKATSDPDSLRVKAREFGLEIAELAADSAITDADAGKKLAKVAWSLVETVGRPSNGYGKRPFYVYRQMKNSSVEFQRAKDFESYNNGDPKDTLKNAHLDFDDEEIVVLVGMEYGDIRTLQVVQIERTSFVTHSVRDNTDDERFADAESPDR